MIAQYRPEIARVAEETVVNLKGLETQIDTLKGDLAALCTVIGHPAAAQIAAAPARLVGPALGISPAFSTLGTFGIGNVGLGNLAFGNLGIAPWGTPYGVSPFVGGVPFGVNPLVGGVPNTLGLGLTPYAPNLANTVPFSGLSPIAGIGGIGNGIAGPVGPFL